MSEPMPPRIAELADTHPAKVNWFARQTAAEARQAAHAATLPAAIARVRQIHSRKRAELAALPAPAQRTAPQRNAARDARDMMLLARAVLILANKAASDDLSDGGATE